MQFKTPLKKSLILFGAAAVALLIAVACGDPVDDDPETTPATEETPTPAAEETPTATAEETPTPSAETTPTQAPAALPGEGVTVQPARATWNTGYFSEAVYSQLLTMLGYDVADHQELDNPLFYQSVAQGDVDFWANGWFPLHNQYEDTFSEGAELVGMIAEAGALEGYLVDKAGADEFGITSLADFTREEVKAAFDADGNGKADLVACPPGWGCNTVIGFHLDEFGLRDHVDELTANYSAGMADAVARFQNGEHILF
ncbi:MAG: glycine betaine/L-proline ABC transporter substrate-binding protein ProX, partial [Ardenticatenaceae bacterium]